MINKLTINFNGADVLDNPGINHAINVKNLLDYSKSYSDTLGQSMFHYVDTATGAVSNEFVADAANHIATRNANYNAGFARRKALLSAGATANITLPLNRYGFFESFKNEIAPNGKVTLKVLLESDNNIIFHSNAAAEGRYIITKWILWVPEMIFNSKGDSLYLSKYLDNHTWTYLKEHVVVSPSSQQRQATFKISQGLRKPRHVFIWALNEAKMENQEQNMFLCNTYNIANAQTFSNAQLELSNGVFYPQEILHPSTEVSKTYDTLMKYQSGHNNYIANPTIDLKSFQNLYGMLYFDLRYQEMELKSGSTKLELRYILSGNPNAAYSLYVLILSEDEISIDVKNGKAALRA